jgi:hypothetical protein
MKAYKKRMKNLVNLLPHNGGTKKYNRKNLNQIYFIPLKDMHACS